jgi:hypothetical protein
MTSRDFCYWLQGFFEMRDGASEAGLSTHQVMTIQKHLHMVFVHEIDPSVGDKNHQDALTEIHEAPKVSPAPEKQLAGVTEGPICPGIVGRPLFRC